LFGRGDAVVRNELADTTRRAWDRLEQWCRRHDRLLLRSLNPGASDKLIDALEAVIERPLPPDVRQSFAIHDGVQGSFVLNYELLSVRMVIRDWVGWGPAEDLNPSLQRDMKSHPAGAIALDYFNPGWIPMAQNASASYLAIDLAPGPVGVIGQVINFGRNDTDKRVLAFSWAAFLTDFATFLESLAESDLDYTATEFFGFYCDYLGRVDHDFMKGNPSAS
jgi:cell wall assembly regulator SMI1